MNINNAYSVLKQVKSGSAGQRGWKRLMSYGRGLLLPKKGVPFDKDVLKQLKELALDSAFKGVDIDEVVEYLKEIKYCQGEFIPEHLEEQIQRFQEADHPYYGHKWYYVKAKAELIEQARSLKLPILQYNSLDDLLEALPREGSAPGWTGKIHGIPTKKKVLEKFGFDQWLKEKQHALKKGSFDKLITIGTRNQSSSPFKNGKPNPKWKKKTRLINVVDVWVIMAERMFSKHYQDWLATMDWYAGGKNDIENNNIIQGFVSLFPYAITIDYSAYDQSISAWLIHDAFDIIEAAMDFKTDEQRQLFKVIRMDFIHKVILDGNLNLRECHKGVPSGSMFTQIVDTLVNRLMVESYLNFKGIENRKMIIMGDDNIIFTGVKLNPDDISGFIRRHFGIEVNSTKMSTADLWEGDFPEFLSREWRPNGVYRDPYELIAKILCPEKFRDYKNNPMLKPEYVISGYVDSFYLGMAEIFDPLVFRKRYHIKKFSNLPKNELAAILPHLPGSVRVQYIT